MTIDDVIKESLIALFSSRVLEKTNPLVLKGGTAVRLIENIKVRMSTDMDFSISDIITTPKDYFDIIGSLLTKHFTKLGLEVFDTDYTKKPKKRHKDAPLFWGGWCFTFKLSDIKNKNTDLAHKRRSALIPDGAASSKIQIEISEHEYCGSTQAVDIEGTSITSYSNIAIVLEKLRALCQAHPDYPYSSSKDRARDYLDIYLLTKKYRSAKFFKELSKEIGFVFKAKDVSFALLKKIFEESFSSFQKSNFMAIQDKTTQQLQPFEFYQEQLKDLVGQLKIE
jgi:predicted nucleotidyltransferase component of viral defense system